MSYIYIYIYIYILLCYDVDCCRVDKIKSILLGNDFKVFFTVTAIFNCVSHNSLQIFKNWTSFFNHLQFCQPC